MGDGDARLVIEASADEVKGAGKREGMMDVELPVFKVEPMLWGVTPARVVSERGVKIRERDCLEVVMRPVIEQRDESAPAIDALSLVGLRGLSDAAKIPEALLEAQGDGFFR